MLIALIGICGVLLGGFLNAAGTYVMARRAEQRDLRTAARILLPELLENQKTWRQPLRLGAGITPISRRGVGHSTS